MPDKSSGCMALLETNQKAKTVGLRILISFHRVENTVCGHWHCSFGHANYEGDGGEFDNNPNFSPYCGKGIIALDACTPVSHKVNCMVTEDWLRIFKNKMRKNCVEEAVAK